MQFLLVHSPLGGPTTWRWVPTALFDGGTRSCRARSPLIRARDLTRLLEHDGSRFAEIVADVRAEVIDTGNRAAADLLASVAPGAVDPEAVAVLLLGALVTLRRTAWTFGAPPLGLDDERALTTWTDMTLTVVQSL